MQEEVLSDVHKLSFPFLCMFCDIWFDVHKLKLHNQFVMLKPGLFGETWLVLHMRLVAKTAFCWFIRKEKKSLRH